MKNIQIGVNYETDNGVYVNQVTLHISQIEEVIKTELARDLTLERGGIFIKSIDSVMIC